jgi:hypothetical protein
MIGDNCSYQNCGKKAIGYESKGRNMSLNVCEDHASGIMKKMQPDSKVGSPGKGEYHYRYPEVKE